MKRKLMVCVWAILLGISHSRAQEPDWNLWLSASQNHPYDVSYMAANSTCNENYGWERSPSDASSGYNKHNPEFDSPTYSGVGIESWYWTPLQNARLIWQEIKGLLPGQYLIKAKVVGQVYNDQTHKGQNRGSLYFRANDQQVAVTSAVWQDVEINCTVEAGTPLYIGLEAGSDNANDWVGLTQVSISCTEIGQPEKIAFNENYDILPIRDYTYADIKLSKKILYEQLSWICLPFDLDKKTAGSYFSEINEIISARHDENDDIELTVKPTECLTFGKVYLVKPIDQSLEVLQINKAIIKPGKPEPVNLGDGVTLCGTYNLTGELEGRYIPSENNLQFTKADRYSKAKGFGAYLCDESNNSTLLNVNIIKNPTNIENVCKHTVLTDVYSANGIRIRHNIPSTQAALGLPKGLYIINGKKIFIQ